VSLCKTTSSMSLAREERNGEPRRNERSLEAGQGRGSDPFGSRRPSGAQTGGDGVGKGDRVAPTRGVAPPFRAGELTSKHLQRA